MIADRYPNHGVIGEEGDAPVVRELTWVLDPIDGTRLLSLGRPNALSVVAVAPRAFWLVWWGTLVNKLGGFVVPLLTIYLISVRKVSVSEAGGVVAMFGAGSLAASLLGGYLADHLGRKATLLISLFGGAAAMIGLSQARSLPAITAMVGVVGLVSDLYRPAVLALVADVVPPAQRIAAYGLLHWVINIGFAVAAVVGGLLADLDFSLLFYADAATTAIYGVLIAVGLPETRPPRSAGAAAGGPRASWLADRALLVYMALTFGIALIATQSVALSAFMTAQGASPAAFGGVIAVNGALIIVLQPALAAACARRDPSRVLAAAALLYGGGFALHGLAPTAWWHAGAVLVWTLGEICEAPTRSTAASGRCRAMGQPASPSRPPARPLKRPSQRIRVFPLRN